MFYICKILKSIIKIIENFLWIGNNKMYITDHIKKFIRKLELLHILIIKINYIHASTANRYCV